MFTTFKNRQQFERLTDLLEIISFRPLSDQELIEFNALFQILKVSAEIVNAVCKRS